MFTVILQALYLFLPAYIANMMPVIFAHFNWVPFLAKPVDTHLFGNHKTWRGLFAGFLGGVITAFFQFVFFSFVSSSHWLFLFPFDFPIAFFWGGLLGFGALIGDLLKSFIKRRLGIKAGMLFFPFDQLDFVFGGLCFGAFVFIPSWQYWLVLVLLTPLLHFLTNLIGFKIGWKKVWW